MVACGLCFPTLVNLSRLARIESLFPTLDLVESQCRVVLRRREHLIGVAIHASLGFKVPQGLRHRMAKDPTRECWVNRNIDTRAF